MMDHVVEGTGPLTAAEDGWTIDVRHKLPADYQARHEHALLCDEFDPPDDQDGWCYVAVTRDGTTWPCLIAAWRPSPYAYGALWAPGFEPGVAFVAETRVLFAGAGERLVAYQLGDRPERLWADQTNTGFWHWSVLPSAVLMRDELKLAAWTRDGRLLWRAHTEPPWDYEVVDGQVRLDIMGSKSEFPLLSGPADGRSR